MRHWIHGGRTDLDNLVLLCDVDHGLAHDLELIMSRRAGRLVVTAPDGGRVWGSADVVIAAGIGSGDDGTESFAGVRAIDEQSGRRPLAPSTGWSSRPSRVGAHIGRPEPAEPLRTADPRPSMT
jgi:hypothetical protein